MKEKSSSGDQSQRLASTTARQEWHQGGPPRSWGELQTTVGQMPVLQSTVHSHSDRRMDWKGQPQPLELRRPFAAPQRHPGLIIDPPMEHSTVAFDLHALTKEQKETHRHASSPTQGQIQKEHLEQVEEGRKSAGNRKRLLSEECKEEVQQETNPKLEQKTSRDKPLSRYSVRTSLRSFQIQLDREYAALDFPGGSRHREQTPQQKEAMEKALNDAQLQEQHLRIARDPMNRDAEKLIEWGEAKSDLQTVKQISRFDLQLWNSGKKAKSKDPNVAGNAMHDLAHEHLRESHRPGHNSIKSFIERHKAAQRKHDAMELLAQSQDISRPAREQDIKRPVFAGVSRDHGQSTAEAPPKSPPQREDKPPPAPIEARGFLQKAQTRRRQEPDRAEQGPREDPRMLEQHPFSRAEGAYERHDGQRETTDRILGVPPRQVRPLLPAEGELQVQQEGQSHEGDERHNQDGKRHGDQPPTQMPWRQGSSSSSSGGEGLLMHLPEHLDGRSLWR